MSEPAKQIERCVRSLKAFQMGKVTVEKALVEIGYLNSINKSISNYIHIFSVALKNGKSFSKMEKANLISDGEFIDCKEEYSSEKIRCPFKDDAIILRSECVELSGTKEAYDVCVECENRNVTRNLLLIE